MEREPFRDLSASGFSPQESVGVEREKKSPLLNTRVSPDGASFSGEKNTNEAECIALYWEHINGCALERHGREGNG